MSVVQYPTNSQTLHRNDSDDKLMRLAIPFSDKLDYFERMVKNKRSSIQRRESELAMAHTINPRDSYHNVSQNETEIPKTQGSTWRSRSIKSTFNKTDQVNNAVMDNIRSMSELRKRLIQKGVKSEDANLDTILFMYQPYLQK